MFADGVGQFPGDASIAAALEAQSQSSLAAEVLRLPDLMAQQGPQDGDDDAFVFPVDPEDTTSSGPKFALSREDTQLFIGTLHSEEIDLGQRSLSNLCGRLERPAVEGLVRRLLAAHNSRCKEFFTLREQLQEMQQAQVEQANGMTLQSQRWASGDLERQSAPTCSAPPGRTGASAAKHRQLAQNSWQRAQDLSGHYRSASEEPWVARLQEQPCMPPSSTVVRSNGQGPMPEVFHRLTGNTAGNAPCEEVKNVSQYLNEVLEDRKIRKQMERLDQAPQSARGGEPSRRVQPRMSEEQANQLYERLTKAGKEQRTRRRVYAELGVMCEDAKHTQSCTFQPCTRKPEVRGMFRDGSGYRGGVNGMDMGLGGGSSNGAPPLLQEGAGAGHSLGSGTTPTTSVTERLFYQDCETRRANGERRRQAQNAAPSTECTFKPRLHGQADGQDGETPRPGAANMRLYREAARKKDTQARAEEARADWKQHPYQPNLSKSLGSPAPEAVIELEHRQQAQDRAASAQTQQSLSHIAEPQTPGGYNDSQSLSLEEQNTPVSPGADSPISVLKIGASVA